MIVAESLDITLFETHARRRSVAAHIAMRDISGNETEARSSQQSSFQTHD
jgi:hypothetical protein